MYDKKIYGFILVGSGDFWPTLCLHAFRKLLPPNYERPNYLRTLEIARVRLICSKTINLLERFARCSKTRSRMFYETAKVLLVRWKKEKEKEKKKEENSISPEPTTLTR